LKEKEKEKKKEKRTSNEMMMRSPMLRASKGREVQPIS